MKKIIATILALTLLCAACAALAEGETRYANFGEALDAAGEDAVVGGGEDYLAVIVEKDGKYIRVVTKLDDKAMEMDEAAMEAEDDMTEKEMDSFFVETLKKSLADMKDCLEYIKDEPGEIYDEIREGYECEIQELSEIVGSINSLGDLAEKDEETIGAVFDYLEGYYDNFVISSDEKKQAADLKEYEKLSILMDMFYDEDEEYDDEEEE